MEKINDLRINEWFRYLVPFIMGIGFSSIYISGMPFCISMKVLSLLFLSTCGTVAYGYFINDWSDIEIDLNAGKNNYAAANSLLTNSVILSILLGIALIPWYFLPRNALNAGFFVLQLILLFIYSVSPIRIKRFPVPCVIIDALYNSLVPALIIVFTFTAGLPLGTGVSNNLILWIMIVCIFLKGLRGILLHQLADRKNDRKTNIKTFITLYGPLPANKIISGFILPFEFITLTTLVVLLSGAMPGLLWLYIGFLLFVAIKYRLWNFRWIPGRNYLFYFRFTLNDFYEEWVPLYSLVLLTIRDKSYLFVLVPFVFLFPTIFRKLYREIPEGVANFRDDIKRKFSATK